MTKKVMQNELTPLATKQEKNNLEAEERFLHPEKLEERR